MIRPNLSILILAPIFLVSTEFLITRSTKQAPKIAPKKFSLTNALNSDKWSQYVDKKR